MGALLSALSTVRGRSLPPPILGLDLQLLIYPLLNGLAELAPLTLIEARA
jgi:hypothetical protein